jgi:hypothetical protein
VPIGNSIPIEQAGRLLDQPANAIHPLLHLVIVSW